MKSSNMMLKSPATYIQGAKAIYQIDKYLSGMGDAFLVIIGGTTGNFMKPIMSEIFGKTDKKIHFEVFKGECSKANVDRLVEVAKSIGATAVLGMGGGKVLDTAKAVGYFADISTVIIPTGASTDAPCSSLSVLYTEDGVFDRYLHLDKCPDMVFVDTEIVAKAPVKLTVAGMGDALATYFEARACRASGSKNQLSAMPTKSATALASLCWENLKQYGYDAKKALEAGEITQAVETIIETNIYLSGVGFESGGLAAAHGIQKGFTVIPELHKNLHGFNVSFCTLAQLVLEEKYDELEEVMDFCVSVGLPTSFKDLGYENYDSDMIMEVAKKACVEDSTIYNLPFSVDEKMVADALVKADALGREKR